MAIGRTNSGMAGGTAGAPKFTYTGTYSLLDDGNRNWRLKFLTSGTLTMQKQINVDVFLVGGGGGAGTSATNAGSAGGCGGYTLTKSQITLNVGQSYGVVIGAGGTGWAAGGTSSAFGFSAAGGAGATIPQNLPSATFKGGSGGGQYSDNGGGAGGSDGSNGSAASGGAGATGIGQGTTTREFGEATGTLYAGGGGGYIAGTAGAGGGGRGGGSGIPPTNGEENTGGGAGGLYLGNNSVSGGSGIVIIRNAR
jgi:hypothetical protein